jgi:CRISPR system Cascade subunit CasA
MSPGFNVLDEHWLPVRMADGQVKDVALLELFDQIEHVSSLAETSPPSLVAQYRLLLAITHRALTTEYGPWNEAHRAKWFREGLPHGVVHAYLNKWRDRFWMFHPQHPFMQVAVLAELIETKDKLKPWTQVSLASANGNTPVVFDHSSDEAPSPILPGVALRELLGFLQFTPGGLVKTLRDADKAGPLSNTAAVLPVGVNLQQTLLLALHPGGTNSDLPAWERDAPQRHELVAEPALPTGANDRYTRLSRAVLFQRTSAGRVQWLHFAAGIAMADDQNAPDPMASFRAGKDKLVRVTFTEGKAFWRDLPALVPDAEGKLSKPATVLGLAANLRLMLGDDSDQPLLVAGVASDQAKLLRWRCEHMTLPPALLSDTRLAGFLRDKVCQAEGLHDRIRSLGTTMLAETMPDPSNKDTRARARALLDGGAVTPFFFSHVERALPQLLHHIAHADADAAENHWSAHLLEAAQASWAVLAQQLGRTPQAIRAEARVWQRFQGVLREFRPANPITQSSEEAQA